MQFIIYFAFTMIIVIERLSLGFYYRFTVRARTNNDVSYDSPPSNCIFVDAPLPTGWIRHCDQSHPDMIYYINIRTKEKSWHRPGPGGRDEYFLEERLASSFTTIELKALRKIFDEVGGQIGREVKIGVIYAEILQYTLSSA